MKHKLTPTILFAVTLFTASGCAYTDIKIPLDIDVNRTVLGPKIGRSSSQSIAWLVAWGDGGTEAAARDGGITTITHLDQHIVSVLFGLYTKHETIAYGE